MGKDYFIFSKHNLQFMYSLRIQLISDG